MILNMPAVLSNHKIGKRERAWERDRIPQEVGTAGSEAHNMYSLGAPM